MQKKCIRLLFSDIEAYINQQEKIDHVDEHGSQKVESDFYIKENTKPLFTERDLLTVHNLYTGICPTDSRLFIKAAYLHYLTSKLIKTV